MRKLAAILCIVAVSVWAMGGLRAAGTTPVILVVVNSAAPNPFGAYLPEILRAEGLTAFTVADLGSLSAPTLDAAALVLLADTPLTAPQAAMLTTYVNDGGRLVAMRPDPQLYGLLGISAAAGATANGYTLIDQGGPGAGLHAVTLPFKGAAQHFTPAGATTVASLYTTSSTASGFPAVVRHGRAAAWAFDLARSTAYTRQGDEALAGIERDGWAPYRTTEPFYQTIDLQRLGVPHADVQMRLLTRVITDLLADALPLPRLWYFPGTARTIVIPTGDSHVATPASYAGLIAAVEAVGARITLYLARYIELGANPVAAWVANGHDLNVHPRFAEDSIAGNFPQGYTNVFDWYLTRLPVPPGPTVRHHTLEWSGWIDPVTVMSGFGIGMDFSYMAYGPAVHNPTQQSQAHGFIGGSGLPMRFVNAAGQVLPVFQQATSLADEQLLAGAGLYSEGLSIADALAVSRQIIDASQAGGYSAIATQFHVDYYPLDEVKPWVDGTLAYVASQQIPMWTARRWYHFVQTRAASAMAGVTWNDAIGQLDFTLAVPAGAPAQSLMLPPAFGTRVLAQVRIDGQSVVPSSMTVSGRTAVVVAVGPSGGGAPRAITLRYVAPSSLPSLTVSDGAVIEGDSGTVTGSVSVSLSAPAATDVAVTFRTADGTAAAPADYDAVTDGVAVIPAGALSAAAAVTVRGDRNYEVDETVLVQVTGALGANVADGAGVLTIINDEPLIAFADGYATAYVTPLVVPAKGVLANDSGGALTAVLVSPPPNGTVTLQPDGGFTYVPNRWFAGIDTFTYRADTAVGTGNTAAVNITVAHPTVVEAPRTVRVATMAGNVVTFRWQPPGVGPQPTGYVLEGGVAPGQPLVALATGPAPVFSVTAPNGSFHVRLRTLGTGGPSGVSNEIPIHVGVPVPPSAPAALQASVVGSSVFLAWAPTFAGGPPAGVVLDVGGSLAAALPLPNVERLSFAGAPPGSFTLSMRAVNGGGSSPPSAPVQIVIPGGCGAAPGPPTDLLGYVAAGTTFLLWDPPLSGGAATGYLVTVPGIGSLPLGQRSISGPLPAGTYTISVHAVGPCGTSAPATTTVTVP
ncbi:MAG: Ig-like domain-containing protein [Vicinamibacterales bacterium]